MTSHMTLGLIAGGGDLPVMLVEHCRSKNIQIVIAGLQNTSAENLNTETKSIFPIAKAGAIISFLKSHKVDQLLICGSLQRPNFKSLIPDAKGLAFISKVILKSMGDDALLKIVRSELELEGFQIIGVQDIMPNILVPHGPLTETKPNIEIEASIIIGWNAARHHGLKDLGQSVVVQNETILGLETEKGTDELLNRCASIQQSEGHRPILVKLAKPQQDMALDAPTIGVKTIENLARLGYAGLIVEAEKTLILNRNSVIDSCNKHSLFLEARTDEDFYNRG